jgi:hypothetical protein
VASQYELAARKQIDEFWQRIKSPLLYVTLTYQVCERDEDNEGWHVAREILDLHLIVHRVSGERLLLREDERGSCDRDWVDDFDDLAAQCVHVPIVHTVTEETLDFVRDETHRLNAAFGGQRGMKTESVAQACVRQWMIKGGRGVESLWVAPDLKRTQFAVNKLCRGEDGRPPLVPSELIVYYPDKHTVRDQFLRWIDGTRTHLLHAGDGKKGGNIKGWGPRWICLDELCEFRSVAIWRVIRGRVNERDGHLGQIFGASTPIEGHWAYTQIVLPIDSGTKANWRYIHLSQFLNVFIPLREAEEALADAGGPDDPFAQREVLGKWSFAGSKLWFRFDPSRHVQTFETIEDLGLVNITEIAIRKAFGEIQPGLRRDVFAGQDYNNVPCSTVLMQVGVPRGSPQTPDNWVLVIVDEFLTNNQQDIHGDLLVAAHGRLAIVGGADGDQLGHSMRLGQSSTEAMELRNAGHMVRPVHYSANFEPVHPPQIDSLRVVHRLMRLDRFYVSVRAQKSIQSFATQQATPRGTIDKVPGTESDKRSGPTDAARYGIWAVAADEMFASAAASGE